MCFCCCCCSVTQSCLTLYIPMDCSMQASLSFTISQSLLILMSIESVTPSNHLILWHPLLLLPSIFPSISIFSNESALGIKWPKYWSFSFSISPSKEYSGLISLSVDRFDLLAVQGTQESSPTPQLKSINSLAFSLLYGPTLISIHDYWNNHSFDYMDLCGQVMCLLFHMLFRFVIYAMTYVINNWNIYNVNYIPLEAYTSDHVHNLWKTNKFYIPKGKKNPMLEYQVSPALFFGPYIFI